MFFTLSASCFMSTVKKNQQLSAVRNQLGFSHKSVLISGVIGGTLLRLRLGREQGLNQHIIRHIELQTLQCDRNYHYEELTECLAKPAETKLLGIIKKYNRYLTTDRDFFFFFLWCILFESILAIIGSVESESVKMFFKVILVFISIQTYQNLKD